MVSAFTENEIEYLRGQRLGRLATTGSGGAPHIVPVGFRLDAQAKTIEIGGHGLSGSKKWRDLQANPKVAFAVDDLASVDPWTPRGIEIRGRAELHYQGGEERFGGGAGTRPGSASCRSGSSAGASRDPRSPRPGAAPGPQLTGNRVA